MRANTVIALSTNDFLITIKNFLNDQYSGFDVTINELETEEEKIQFLSTCLQIVENGWQIETSDLKNYDFFSDVLQKLMVNPLNNFFKNRGLDQIEEPFIILMVRLQLFFLICEYFNDNKNLFSCSSFKKDFFQDLNTQLQQSLKTYLDENKRQYIDTNVTEENVKELIDKRSIYTSQLAALEAKAKNDFSFDIYKIFFVIVATLSFKQMFRIFGIPRTEQARAELMTGLYYCAIIYEIGLIGQLVVKELKYRQQKPELVAIIENIEKQLRNISPKYSVRKQIEIAAHPEIKKFFFVDKAIIEELDNALENMSSNNFRR